VFTPVLAKHSKSFSLIDCISVGVDRMQRNFEPLQKRVETWQRFELADVTAKVVIYEAFVEGKLEAPKHLARAVHDLYFEPKYEEFRPRTIWSSLQRVHIGVQGIGADPAGSRRRPSSKSFWRPASHKLFEQAWRCRPDRRSLLLLSLRAVVLGGRRSLPPLKFP
jgi:hypothetical protein